MHFNIAKIFDSSMYKRSGIILILIGVSGLIAFFIVLQPPPPIIVVIIPTKNISDTNQVTPVYFINTYKTIRIQSDCYCNDSYTLYMNISRYTDINTVTDNYSLILVKSIVTSNITTSTVTIGVSPAIVQISFLVAGSHSVNVSIASFDHPDNIILFLFAITILGVCIFLSSSKKFVQQLLSMNIPSK